MPPDFEYLSVGILRIFKSAARSFVQTEIDIATIRRKCRLTQFFLVLFIGLFDHCDTAATVTVIEPDLTRAQGALRREVLAGCDVGAIW